MRRPEVRERFVAGRSWLRRILSCYQGQPPESIAFAYGESGKPSVAGPVSFSLSHSGDLAAVAVARFEIGVDIELVRPIEPETADGPFSPLEIAALAVVPAQEFSPAFLRIWTQKEAYLKALGCGFLGSPRGFSVNGSPHGPTGILRVEGDENEAAYWQVREFAPRSDAIGAVAARRVGWRLRDCTQLVPGIRTANLRALG